MGGQFSEIVEMLERGLHGRAEFRVSFNQGMVDDAAQRFGVNSKS